MECVAEVVVNRRMLLHKSQSLVVTAFWEKREGSSISFGPHKTLTHLSPQFCDILFIV